MSLKNNKNLFDFDKRASMCHCEEEAFATDAAIQEKRVGLLHYVRNDKIIIGTDEAGRGPGAGGVFASAVYFPNPDAELIEKLSNLNDSKKLSKKVREELFEVIIKNSIHSTVCIEVEEIEKINILNASLKAMKLVCENVINEINSSNVIARQKTSLLHKDSTEAISPSSNKNEFLILVDGNKLIKNLNSHLPSPLAGEGRVRGISQQCIIKGDSKSASIAAASILAKVTRDRYMQELDAKFPQYKWKNNAGYLTKQHLEAIDKYGVTPIHRKTFLRKHFEKEKSAQLNLNLN